MGQANQTTISKAFAEWIFSLQYDEILDDVIQRIFFATSAQNLKAALERPAKGVAEL